MQFQVKDLVYATSTCVTFLFIYFLHVCNWYLIFFYFCSVSVDTVQVTNNFTATPLLLGVPQHISQITLVMFSSAQGTHEY